MEEQKKFGKTAKKYLRLLIFLTLISLFFPVIRELYLYFERTSPERYEFLQLISKGDLVKIKGKLEKNPKLVNACLGSDCIRALSSAVQSENVELVKLLIKMGADVNIEDGLAMKYAKFRKNQEIINLLKTTKK